MQTATITRVERDTLFTAHQALAQIHGKIAEITAAQHSRDESAEVVLDAQLAISDAMLAVSRALDVRFV